MTEEKIKQICDNLKQFLLEKNKRYGDSALKPLSIFSRQDSQANLFVRIDDKLSRIKNSEKLRRNDVIDLIGYLILVCIKNEWIHLKDLID